jgi:hypothetical protein
MTTRNSDWDKLETTGGVWRISGNNRFTDQSILSVVLRTVIC